MQGTVDPDKELDTSGLLCPMPVVQARLTMDKLQAGQVLIDAAGGPLMVTAVIEAIQRVRVINPRAEGRITISR